MRIRYRALGDCSVGGGAQMNSPGTSVGGGGELICAPPLHRAISECSYTFTMDNIREE